MPYEGLASPLRVGPVALPGGGGVGGGKPVMRRGPGRPRTRGGITQPQVRTKRPIGLKLKRWKGLLVSGVYGTGNGKVSQEGEADESTSPIQPSTPIDQQIKAPIFVDEPLFSEQWPGKLCILCNLSEHSQLGQGEMLRIECSVEDLPKDVPRDILMSPPESLPHDSTSPRQPLQVRRQKGPSKCRHFVCFRNAGTNGQEPVDELSLVGHVDIPEPGNIVDSGYIYIHEWCAVWCSGVSRSSNDRRRLDNVGSGVMVAVSRRCWHCGRYGAGVACAISTCSKHFHTPCAAASAAFQHPKTLLLICNQHIDHVATMRLRAGWQCSDCRTCQLCRISTEDSTRMLVCEACDKTYHPSCVRPAMSSVPKVGWKCTEEAMLESSLSVSQESLLMGDDGDMDSEKVARNV
ncbi:hypothetical protein AAG570_000812 [Ranatra chinensis]|uniref:PHD-type domain-containing protein n=1 Tax=Ranatra chinensis TaxID=642074 RepID=A0ABD0Z086_9HEMI